MEKGFDIEPVYKEKYLKIEIKPYHGETNTYFYDNGMLKEVSHCVKFSKTLLDSVLKQVKTIIGKYFKRYKVVVKQIKMRNVINKKLKIPP